MVNFGPIIGGVEVHAPKNFIVQNQQTGLLVPKNVQGNALKIRHLLDLPQIAVKMGQLTQIRIREELSWERHIDPYDHLYQELIHS